MLNPLHLKTLRVILEQNSFAAAAAELDYTASAVSQQMSALERSTGLTLFERLPRSVRPTPAAYDLAGISAGILAALHSLEYDARALASAERGQIRIGSFRTASARILPQVLAEFRVDRPEVTIQLDEGEPDDILPRILEGSLDVAVVYENDLAPREWPSNLTRLPLLSERRFLLMPPESNPTKGPVRLSDLQNETWIASKPSPSLFRLCVSVGFKPNVALRTNDYYSVCAFVRAGLGIALVPELSYIADMNLNPRELLPKAPERHISAIFRPMNSNPLLQPFVDKLQSVISLRYQEARQLFSDIMIGDLDPLAKRTPGEQGGFQVSRFSPTTGQRTGKDVRKAGTNSTQIAPNSAGAANA